MILAMGLDSEFDYFVDFDKVLRMMLMHETEEIIIGDLTEWDGVSKEEKLERGNEAVSRLLGRLNKKLLNLTMHICVINLNMIYKLKCMKK